MWRFQPFVLVLHFTLVIFSLTWVSVQSAGGMDRDDIVPDVISVAPQEICSVTYPSASNVNLGNELTPTQVKDLPTIKWKAENNQLYALFLTDPDAPSRSDPQLREVLHWLVVNIPGSDVAKGDTLVEFIGSGPPQGTGFHRYVFLIYKQPGKIDVADHPRTTNRSVDGRPGFKVSQWASKYNLGTPVAGNYYLSQYDDYVPILHKQIGF